MNKKPSTFFSWVLIIFLLVAILVTVRPYIPVKQKAQETTTAQTHNNKEENTETKNNEKESTTIEETTTTSSKETYLAETTTVLPSASEEETKEQATKLPLIEPSATTTSPINEPKETEESTTFVPSDTSSYNQKLYLTVKQIYQTNYDVYQEVLALVNELRTKEGVAPLMLDDSLCLASSMRAYEIAYKNFSHIRPNGQDYAKVLTYLDIPFVTVWENIAAGQSDAIAVVESWCSSPQHYQTMMNPDFKKLGVGVIYDTSLPYQYYWAQMFIQ